MIKSLLKVQNLREKQEVLLPHQSAGGVDLSHGTLTGMANMTRLVVDFVDVCLFCFAFSIVGMANMTRLVAYLIFVNFWTPLSTALFGKHTKKCVNSQQNRPKFRILCAKKGTD